MSEPNKFDALIRRWDAPLRFVWINALIFGGALALILGGVNAFVAVGVACMALALKVKRDRI